jgi:GrpB-like predicted nucleotidyltransferase (UPF0157 family)
MLPRVLGLDRGVVKVVPYSGDWATAFATERSVLADALDATGCRIEHVGSTSVPGLAAKPILDIAVGHPADVAAQAIVALLEGIGYVYGGDAGGEGGHVLARVTTGDARTHHLHLVALDDPQWASYLAFRDYLRANEPARAAYRDAKYALAARFPSDRKAYTAGKHEIVERLLSEARLEAKKNRGWREVAALDAAYAAGDLDDAGWHRGLSDLLVPAYTATTADVRRGSGHTGTAEDWEWSRGIVADAIDRSGTFLDVGCANGLLMESVVRWTARRGLAIEPYGLDIAPELAAIARERLPQWAARIFVGNALGWRPPHRFDLVRTGLEYVPPPRRRELVAWLLEHVVAPGGRLLVGKYNEEIERPEIERQLVAWGFAIAARHERAHRTEPRLVYRVLALGHRGST